MAEDNQFKITWPPPQPFMEGLRRILNQLDFQTRIGEEPYEIEGNVSSSKEQAGRLFFVWLVAHGHDDGAEVLAEMIEHFIEHVYLVKWSRQASLAKVSKPQLEEFLHLVEFSVPTALWDSGINPFDGIVYFYRFLESIGYSANPARRERAIKDLRKRIIKQAYPMLAPGAMTMQ